MSRKIQILKNKIKTLEEIRLKEECLNSFERFLDFVNVKNKEGEIIKYKDYLEQYKRKVSNF